MTPAAKKPTLDALDKLFDTAEAKYGSPVGTLDTISSPSHFITTGNMSFDLALGGGFPLGRLVELAGPPSCGKTTLATMAAAALQKLIMSGGDPTRGIKVNDVILYVDFENAVDKDYMRKLGVDTGDTSLRFTQPDFLESGAQLILDAMRTGRVRMVVVDSVAGMNPRAVSEADVGKSLPAILAKTLTPWGTTLQGVAKEHNCLVVFINHEKEVMSMGGRPGMPAVVSTPGGVALKYFQSQRLSFRQGSKIYIDYKDPVLKVVERRAVGSDVHMTVVKNKVAPPYRKALARVRENRGFDNFWSAMSILLAHRIVASEAGGMFYFHKLAEAGLVEDWMTMSAPKAQTPARPYIRGLENVYTAADEHPAWRDAIIAYTETILPTLLADVAVGSPDDMEEEEETDEDLAELDAIESAGTPGKTIS